MTDKEKRDAAIDAFAQEMKLRLDEKAAEGYVGWDNPSCISDDTLIRQIATSCDEIAGPVRTPQVCKRTAQESIDIANRAMFLWYRNDTRRLGRS